MSVETADNHRVNRSTRASVFEIENLSRVPGYACRSATKACSPNKMTNWQHIIDHFLQMSDPKGEYDHYSPAGASEETLAKLEAELGISLPPELREFYRHCDGLGLVFRDGSSMPLFVRPTHELAEYVQSCRSSFSETHPTYAQRYFPCVDWYNGDSSGFMMGVDGRFLEEIYTFSHESYSYDEDQDVSDFLMAQADSLALLLNPE